MSADNQAQSAEHRLVMNQRARRRALLVADQLLQQVPRA